MIAFSAPGKLLECGRPFMPFANIADQLRTNAKVLCDSTTYFTGIRPLTYFRVSGVFLAPEFHSGGDMRERRIRCFGLNMEVRANQIDEAQTVGKIPNLESVSHSPILAKLLGTNISEAKARLNHFEDGMNGICQNNIHGARSVPFVFLNSDVTFSVCEPGKVCSKFAIVHDWSNTIILTALQRFVCIQFVTVNVVRWIGERIARCA